MYPKKFLKDYFTFGRKDRLGLIALMFMTLLVYFLPYFFPSTEATLTTEEVFSSQQLDSVQQFQSNYTPTKSLGNHSKRESTAPVALFPFDPNHLNVEEWIKLGLRPKTAQTIINYRNKGGTFKTKEDLKKIWGLPPGFYERVEPYISIEAPREAPAFNTNYTAKKTEEKIRLVNINQTDTALLISLPRIGSKLANRIIGFREKLGGFVSVEQVGETYGLADSVFQKIKPFLIVSGKIRQFNINSATKDQLKEHPYIRWKLANAIVEFRNQHGLFKSIDEIRNIALIDETTFKKLSPYLTLE